MIRRRLVLAALAAPGATALAQSPGAAASVPARPDQVFAGLRRLAWQALELPASATLEPALRQRGEALVREHGPRLEDLLRSWTDEEIALQGGDGSEWTIAMALMARWANSLARWSLHSAGAGHDRAWWRAMTTPQGCLSAAAPQFLRIVLERAQRLMGPDRQVLLDADADALALCCTDRWPPPPVRPALDIAADAAAAVEALRTGRRDPVDGPMVPALAATHFVADGQRAPLTAWTRDCATAVWWVRQQVATAAGPTPDQVLALRYANLLSADRVLPALSEGVPTPAPHEYPTFARQFEVGGDVTVEAEVDAAGRLQRARVVDRRIRVPGIRDGRPIAFETLLDGPALAQAEMRPPRRPASVPEWQPYRARATYQFAVTE